MENNILPTIKIYKIDYSFLIRNYLNPELWDKKWTLFAYKNYTITLNIYKILTKERKICFEVAVHSNALDIDNDNCASCQIECSLKIEDLTFMKRQINSAIFNCMVNFEKYYIIEHTDQYNELSDQMYDERYKLRKYANEFLDEVGITSETCRDAYADAYVDENETVYWLRDKWEDEQIYRQYPDFYLVFLGTLEDDPKKEIRTKEILNRLSNDRIKEIEEEIKDFQILFEDEENFEKELKSKLEEV